MRKRFTVECDSIYIDCLNGGSRETGKLTFDGKPDPSVFATESNPEGIRLGTGDWFDGPATPYYKIPQFFSSLLEIVSELVRSPRAGL